MTQDIGRGHSNDTGWGATDARGVQQRDVGRGPPPTSPKPPGLSAFGERNLEVFRREHVGVTIWCGTQSEGGCGRQLTTRKCTHKICHFAHYGSGGTGRPCGRKDRGKEDANRLYAKAISRPGCAPRPSPPNSPSPNRWDPR